MAASDGALEGPLDLERVRVKLELARARLGGPSASIPVGRVYDSPDGAALDAAAGATVADAATSAQRDQDAALALASFRQGGSEHAPTADVEVLQKVRRAPELCVHHTGDVTR